MRFKKLALFSLGYFKERSQVIQAQAWILFILFFIVCCYVVSFVLKTNTDSDKKYVRVMQRVAAVKHVKAWMGAKKIEGVCTAVHTASMDIAGALRSLQKWADISGVIVEDIRLKEPYEVRAGGVYKRTPIELSVVASESDWVRFWDGLGQLKFLCAVVHVAVKNDSKVDDRLRCQMRLDKIDVIQWPTLEEGYDVNMLVGLKKHTTQGLQRKLFKIPNFAKPKNIAIAADGNAQAIKDVNLVGIVDDGGRKVVLEDKKTSKTYFLSCGDEIAGARVTEIKDNAAVLELAGVLYTLSL